MKALNGVEVIVENMAKKELLEFRIDQLRKDNMICALESIALTFIVELGYLLISILSRSNYSVVFAVLALILPTTYFVYMVLGNTKRMLKIKKLEKELYKE